MKTFFTIFLAILAAAVVISGALAAKSRLDNWNKAKNACLQEIHSMSEAISDLSAESAGGNLAELDAALSGMFKAQKRIEKAKDLLVSLLENKPFGLPLTADEKRLLRQTKPTTPTEATAQETKPTIKATALSPSTLASSSEADYIKLVKSVTLPDGTIILAGMALSTFQPEPNFNSSRGTAITCAFVTAMAIMKSRLMPPI